MDDSILITELNDFIFCPVSIYFHKLYGTMETMLYQSSNQINGTNAHKAIDAGTYSSQKNILMGMDVYCEKYKLIGKIDMYNTEKHLLRERKKRIKTIYNGYVFQVYAQCFALREMGYIVDRIELYSMDDHKIYSIPLPEHDADMLRKFEKTICSLLDFSLDGFEQTNQEKCKHCIYEPACDRALIVEV